MVMARTVEQAQIDAETLRLRSNGWSYRRIAAETKGTPLACSPKVALERCRRALRDVAVEAVEEHRALELERLDNMTAAANEIAAKHHVYVSASGKVVYDGDERLRDDGPVLAAINTLIRISERRAKLLGLDAPARAQVEVVTYDAGSIDARIAEIRSAIGHPRGEPVPVG